MIRAAHLFGLGLLAIIAVLLMVAAPEHAFAQVARNITNVATLDWGAPDDRNRISSNRVDTPLASSAVINSAPFALPGDDLSQTLLDSSCAATATSNTGPPASASLAGRSLVPITRLVAGQSIVLAIDRPMANREASIAESINLYVRTGRGDEEYLGFVETSANSGRFVAIVRTSAARAFVSSDCRLALEPTTANHFRFSDTAGGPPVTEFAIDVLVDPYGIAFDSRDGTPISGVRITIIDVATGQPAQVFGDDGLSTYPSSVITGQTVTDSSGNVYDFPAGDYRFPLVRRGTYRLIVEPVAPYSFASAATATQISSLRRGDGQSFAISPGSYGSDIILADAAPVRIDIPLDRPLTPIVAVKTASRDDAESGDLIQYRVIVRNPDAAPTGALTVSDRIPEQTRLRPETVRLDGLRVSDPGVADRTLTFSLPSLAPGASIALTYVLEVRPGAQPGDALNRVRVSGPSGNSSNVADALVRIRRDTIGQRLTIVGRVIDGGCGVDPAKLPGLAGVRIMMEDGSYAVTDRDGRYHFEGIRPGTHVVQMDDMTLPPDRIAVDCAQSVRSGGRAISRFVDGQDGMLKRVDFHAITGAKRSTALPTAGSDVAAPSDQDAAGAQRDWLAGEQPGIAWLFPTLDHNPRAPVIRVAIKHFPGQTVRLKADGRLVDAVTSEGTRRSASGAIAVSLWRGVPIDRQHVELSAEILDAKGQLVQRLKRSVRFANTAVRAELVRARSRLIADGVTRPVLALRLTDAAGRPVHHGLAGDFTLPAPYYAAIEADAQQARQLAGLERARPTWRVVGDDGIALVELEPTTASGSLSVRFAFRDGQRVRAQRLEAWLDPGERAWTVVGLAEGTLGFNRLNKHLESFSAKDEKTTADGRLALYAKGRIKGRWLLTVAYDSDNKRDDSRFAGVIDPTAYYTVYADRSEQRYDASSLRKLYLKLERPQFYALFGDYDTAIDEPVLTRYVRSLNGSKAEYRSDQVSVLGFASDTPTRHRRDEIHGNGLSSPYRLWRRNLLANSERIMIETRDRLRSNRIVDSHLLTRHIDYDIDYAAGTLRFREPILSRSSAGDPQFIIADYEVDGIAARTLNAGGRIAVRSKDQKLQIAATAIRDADDTGHTDLGGIDLRYRPTAATEIRAEAAASRTEGHDTAATTSAWLVEVEHHAGPLDVLAYASRRGAGFGTGHTNAVESGTRKVGIDARAQLTKAVMLSASAWREDSLTSASRRTAGRALLEYRGPTTSARAGIVFATDRLSDGRDAASTLLQLGATQRLLGNRLELDAQTELPIGGKDESVDFPARHKLAARFSISRAVALVGSYEIANGETINSRVARIGFDLAPWAGARIALSGNIQDIAEYGPRSFAAFGLSQSLVVSKALTIDASLDSNRTIGGIDRARVINPLHPVASGGFLPGDGSLTEDFTAVTAGATWRSPRWTVTGRGEWRDGERDNRYGATFGALRQVGEGSAVGGSLNWFTARSDSGAATRTVNAQLSWAHWPANSEWSLLDKLELRADRVENAVAGQLGPVGTPLNVSGNARSNRMINSLSVNWSPRSGKWLDRTEVALFWGARYVADRYEGDDIKGLSNVVGADVRFDLGRRVEVGAAATVRAGLKADSVAFSVGPQLSLAPVANSWIQLGWNVAGFRDRDFSEDRYTRDGPYATLRVKFDQLSFAGLGLGRK